MNEVIFKVFAPSNPVGWTMVDKFSHPIIYILIIECDSQESTSDFRRASNLYFPIDTRKN